MEPLIPDDNLSACRICLDAKCPNRFKFEVVSEWSQLFEYCVGLTISEGNAPQVLCTNCADRLKDYAGFKSQCLQADMMWKQLPYPVKSETYGSIELERKHGDFDRLEDCIPGISYMVKSESYEVETEPKSDNENGTPGTVIASPLKIPKKRSKRKTSKSNTAKRKSSKHDSFMNDSESKSKSHIKYEEDDVYMSDYSEGKIKAESEDLDTKHKGKKPGKRPKRMPIIPIRITPYTEEERLERKAIGKKTNIKKYLESIGKANENYMTEKEFLRKYYNELPPEISKKTSKMKTVFGCRKCAKKLKSKKSLVTHTKVCSRESQLNVILDHELKGLLRGPTLPVAQILYCGICEFTAKENDSITNHWNEHIASNRLDCQLCTYAGRDMADMVAHRYKHHPPEFRHWIKCPLCPLRIMQVNKLEYHYRSEHLNKKGGLCSYCDKEFVDYKSWTCHQIKHTVDRFICDHCGRNFMYRHDIEYHLDLVFGTKKYTCETCGRGFKRMSNLRLHIRCRHTESKPIKCDHCDRMFKNEKTLNFHLKQIQEPKCFCEICGKGFPRPGDMKNHMFRHTGERPYKCDVCGSGFNNKYYLKIHMRGHTGHKPFSCPTCSKAFTTSMQLKSHQSVHTGIRRVKCPYCERTFYDKKRMISHCKLKHQIIITKDEPKYDPSIGIISNISSKDHQLN